MRDGLLPGLNATTWRSFKPQMICVNGNADGSGLTQPFLDTFNGRSQFGRFMQIEKLVVVQVQNSFTGVSTVGAGSAYAFRLPVRAKRPVPGASTLLPIGESMAYLSITDPYVNVPCVATLADPWASLNGDEDNWYQLYTPRIVTWGTGTIAASGSGVKSVTIAHTLGFAPAASDIIVTRTDTAGTNNDNPTSIQNITTTSFDVFYFNATNAGARNFSWKADCEPPTGQGGNLVGPQKPFDMTRGFFVSSYIGPFPNIFTELIYEAA